MNYIIYIDNEGQLRAYCTGIPSDFQELHETLTAEQIIHLNGESYPDNIPDAMLETAHLFIKSVTRQWLRSVTMVAPKPLKAKQEEPVAAPKLKAKKKTTRKKKAV